MLLRVLSVAILIVVYINISIGQRPGGSRGGDTNSGITGSISGIILDANTAEPVEFATLLLKQITSAEAPNNEKQINGVVTDIDGTFRFAEVPMGDYIIEVSFIGYTTTRTANLSLTGRKPDLKLGTVELSTSAAMLETAVVTGEAELVENRVDKVVYNASQDVANQGGDGADVLRRVPLLSVDLDGNVQLRGSSQVQILINGRPSTMFAGSVGEALQAMPADEIEKVEVVTSPGARYQGEGTAGIINIITKRGGLKGLTGSVSASIGTRSNNANSNLAYSKGRFGVNGGLGTRFSWNRPTETSLVRTQQLTAYNGIPGNDGSSVLTQNASGNSAWLGLNGSVGAFYDVNAFNSFTTSLRMRGRRRNSDLFQTTAFDRTTALEDIAQRYTSDRVSTNPAFNIDWTTDYKRKFEGKDHELNLAVQVGQSIRDQNYDLLVTSLAGDFEQRDEEVFNSGRNLEYTLQADYQKPLTEKFFFETGAQGVLRRLTSDYTYTQRAFGSSEAYLADPNRSNIFDYDQDVYAGYVSLRSTLSDKVSTITGLRYEYTEIMGSRRSPEPGEMPFANDYGSLLPSASIQYKLTESSSLRLAYTRRIQRPGLRYVNPFVDASDPRFVEVGNPALEPEISDQIELTTNGRIKGGFFNASVFYKRTSDEISPILITSDSSVTTTTFLNLGQSSSYGASLFSSYTLAKIIKLRASINAERLELVGSGRLADLSRSVWQYGGNGSFTIELPGDYVVESFGFYRAPRQSLQGEQASFTIWSIGAQKKLLDDRWRLGIRIVEPFSRSKKFPSERSGPDFVQTQNYEVLFRSFGINARYKFGSLKGNGPRERRSKIDGGGDSEGGGEF